MKKKKIVIVAIFLIIGCLFWGYNISKPVYTENSQEEIQSIERFNDNLVLVNFKEDTLREPGARLFIEGNYIIQLASKELFEDDTNYALNKKTSDYKGATSSPIGDEEYYNLYIYDIESSEPQKPKVVNLLEAINKDMNIGYRTDTVDNIWGIYNNGSAVYFYHNFGYVKDGKLTEKIFAVDLETGQLANGLSWEEIKESEKLSSFSEWDKLISFTSIEYDVQEKIQEETGVGVFSEGMLYLDNAKDLSLRNFSERYPDLIEKKSKNSIVYIKPNQFNEKEWFDNLLHWFAPRGQDVLEVYVTNEETGEKTQIKSAAEYESWLQTYPPYLEWKAESEQKGNQ